MDANKIMTSEELQEEKEGMTDGVALSPLGQQKAIDTLEYFAELLREWRGPDPPHIDIIRRTDMALTAHFGEGWEER